MSILLHGDCLEHMKSLEDNSVDFIFCDLPYGQTSCKWDIIVPWEPFWEQIMRIKKLNTPVFFTTTTKFGVQLINSAPKKMPFRWDLVWVKSAPAGFLSAKKMPMRKHEMIYAFYEKLPMYDLSSHKHKFSKKATARQNGPTYGGGGSNPDAEVIKTCYEPSLPTSVVKEQKDGVINNDNMYRGGKGKQLKDMGNQSFGESGPCYEPPLPVSVVKEINNDNMYRGGKGKPLYDLDKRNGKGGGHYEPPLPTSVVKEPEHKWVKGATDIYGGAPTEDSKECGGHQQRYDPPLPTSVVKDQEKMPQCMYGDLPKTGKGTDAHSAQYDPQLPNSILEVKSTRGKHSTEKPVALMEWLLKYFSKEGDVVLDPTMGSGSTGVACKNMNRNFIGIEMNDEIYEVAVNRIEN